MEATDYVKTLVSPWTPTIQCHVANLCHACYYHLREQRRVSRHINYEMVVKVANAKISSRLDYYNSLLHHTKRQLLVNFSIFVGMCLSFLLWTDFDKIFKRFQQ